MAIDANTQQEMLFVVSQIVQLSNVLVQDGSATSSELATDTKSKLNKDIQDLCDYLDSLVPVVNNS